MPSFFETAATIFLAITTVAIVAVVVSRNSQTAGVIQATFSGFGNALGVAEAPVTGTAVPLNLSYPGSSSYGYGQSGFNPAQNFPTF